MNAEARTGELSERARAQRERILCAAERCFARRGFHAASIADIAGTAEMSPGLIYRYFANKNAIVLAIIERQLQEGRGIIDRAQDPGDLVGLVMHAFDHWSRRDDDSMSASMFLEIAAETSRDADIARTAHAADEAIRASLGAALQRSAQARGRTLAAAELRSRTLLLQCLIEGLAVRVLREPGLDRAELAAILDRVVPRLVED